jgi:flavin-dependent dehydrogenase
VAAYWLTTADAHREPDRTTLVEAAADGWWYTTPVPGGRRAVAFLTDSDLFPRRDARAARNWEQRLKKVPHVREALASAGCDLRGEPAVVDAGVAHLEQVAGPGWVAAGDAAVSFDPLSSQGILTALLMGRGAGHALAVMLTRADPQPLVRWGREYGRLLQAHLRLRAAYYAAEQRWPTEAFWARRHPPQRASLSSAG